VNAYPVIPRQRAYRDVDEALEYLVAQAPPSVASGFIDAVEDAYWHLAQFPESGSPRLAQELEMPGLRCWPLRGYPYLICYRWTGASVDVWRMLHQQRDLQRWLEP